MRKAVAIVSQDPELEKMVNAISEIDKHYDQRREFLVKQANTLKAERKAQVEPILKGIREHLQTKGLLSTDLPEKHHLHLDHESDTVMVCDGEDHGGGHPMLRMLMGMGVPVEELE